MTLTPEIRRQILERLTRQIKIRRIILFGSHAVGTPDEDSDIDLLVVTDEDYIPENFEQNMHHYLKVSSALRDIKRKLPIDLIVHTKPMHEKFVQLGSSFSKEVTERGEILYEKDS
jgi:uncharacterized protein